MNFSLVTENSKLAWIPPTPLRKLLPCLNTCQTVAWRFMSSFPAQPCPSHTNTYVKGHEHVPRCSKSTKRAVVTSASCTSENGAPSSHDLHKISWTNSFWKHHHSAPCSAILVSTYDGYSWLLFLSIVTLELGTLFLSRKHSPNILLQPAIRNDVSIDQNGCKAYLSKVHVHYSSPIPCLFYTS